MTMNRLIQRKRLALRMRTFVTVAAAFAMVLLPGSGLILGQEPYAIKDPEADGTFESPGGMTPLGSIVVMTAGPFNNRELYRSDGTEQGSVLVKEINSGGSSGAQQFTAVGDLVFFVAIGGPLWRTDGTEEGTQPVDDLQPGSFISPDYLTAFKGLLFFRAQKAGEVYLWRSDGTDTGTFVVKELDAGGPSAPTQLIVANDTLYFIARLDGDPVTELWKSDGTETGTASVAGFSEGGPAVQTEPMAVLGDSVYFSGTDGPVPDNLELWKSDGAAEGTFQVKEINPDGQAFPEDLTAVGDWVFFSAVDETGDRNLWTSDGTEEGTFRLSENLTLSQLFEQEDEAIGNVLFFAAADALGDRELWKSDGTVEGTVRVRDIRTNGSSAPEYLESVGDRLFFAATDDDGDRELWTSDGTEEGTFRLHEIKDDGSSSPEDLVNCRGRLYFSAAGTTGSGQRSLYALDVATPHVANLSTRGFVGTGDSVMIAGIIIEDGPKEVIIRAIGPGLDAFGVPNTLNDPTLTLFSGATLIGSNDDWQETQQAAIEATGFAPGFPTESAIVLELEAGAYTAIVSGGVGNALVELFELH
jgi:ELWxxDGT repeat protein